jgi:hypothetical protein
MDQVGASDITVGQTWLLVVDQPGGRLVWTVTHRDTDSVLLERDGSTQRVFFGSLLAGWALVEAAS